MAQDISILTRRSFQRSLLAGVAAAVGIPRVVNADATSRHRVAVIGHTGRGDFGHRLDTAWMKIPESEIVGVSDGDSDALPKAVKRLRLPPSRGYADYRILLRETNPEFVAVCPRHVDQHHDMCWAAIQSGARGLYVEKPFLRTPAEADTVLAAAKKTGCLIAVAHRNRYHPALPVISRLIDDGIVGRVLEIRGRGKGDRRGGPEDLWVLGSHVLNLFDYFGRGVKSVSAQIFQDGQPLSAQHELTSSQEGMGLIGGNEVRARYRLANGLSATFDSIANNGLDNAGFGLRIVGSKGIIQLYCDQDPIAYLIPGNPLKRHAKPPTWIPITAAGVGKAENDEQRQAAQASRDHTRAILDLIAATKDPSRSPLCDGKAGARTIEMICGVIASHLAGGSSIPLPLADREPSLVDLAR